MEWKNCRNFLELNFKLVIYDVLLLTLCMIVNTDVRWFTLMLHIDDVRCSYYYYYYYYYYYLYLNENDTRLCQLELITFDAVSYWDLVTCVFFLISCALCLLGAIAYLRKATTSFVMHIHIVHMQRLWSHCTIFHKILHFIIFRNCVEKIQVFP
jgi:hypothetical protein